MKITYNDYHQFEISDFQVANLKKLATKLESLPADYAQFEMSVYLDSSLDEDDASGSTPEMSESMIKYALENGGIPCGSVACAVGHGPSAGILFLESEIGKSQKEESINWSTYSFRVFTDDAYLDSFLFGGVWNGYDNTIEGAAARIRYVLAEAKIPIGFTASYHKAVAEYAPYIKQKVPT